MRAGKDEGEGLCGGSGEIAAPVCRDDHLLRDGGRDERGALTVLFALLLPVILILGVVVVDVGNWWVHRRHLQTLVDAGALAAAPKFVGCSFQFGDPGGGKRRHSRHGARLRRRPDAGSGNEEPAGAGAGQRARAPQRSALLATRRRDDGGPGLDDTWDIDAERRRRRPCSERSLDVKATDDAVPLLFGFLPFVADPKTTCENRGQSGRRAERHAALGGARGRARCRGRALRRRDQRSGHREAVPR